MTKSHTKKILIRSTATLGALLVCGGALTNASAVMHADETTTSTGTSDSSNTGSHTESATPTTPTNTTTLDGNKWTAVDKAKTITRTIHYIDEDGKTVAPDVVETHTGEVFTAKEGDKDVKRAFTIVNGVATNTIPKFAAVQSPVVKGYTLKSTQYATIPEQGWSLDGTQVKNATTGFYDNLSQDEVINVVYKKDPSTALKDVVPVSGYTVLNVKTLTRTINYVTVDGTKLADSVVQTVKFETVASDKLTPKEQQEKANQKVAVVNVAKDADGNITSQTTQILNTPAYKLDDVKSPTIKGYVLQNKAFKSLTGQYFWLSSDAHSEATLANGLRQFVDQDEIVDVVYIPGSEAKKNKNKKTKQAEVKTDDAKETKDGKDAAAAGAAAGSDSGSGDGSASAGSVDASGDGAVSGGDSGSVLPQTGNTKASTSLLGAGIAMLLSSVGLAWDGLKKRFAK